MQSNIRKCSFALPSRTFLRNLQACEIEWPLPNERRPVRATRSWAILAVLACLHGRLWWQRRQEHRVWRRDRGGMHEIRTERGARPPQGLATDRERDVHAAVATGADDRRRGLLRRRCQGRARRLQARARRCRVHDPVRRARGERLGGVLERVRAARAKWRCATSAAAATRYSSTSRTGRVESGFRRRSGGYLRWTRCAELCSSRQALARSRSSSASLPSVRSTHSKPSLRISRATPLTVQGRHFRASEVVRLTTGSRNVRTKATGSGYFVITIPGADRCNTQRVVARGSAGELRDRKAAARTDVLAGALLGVARS